VPPPAPVDPTPDQAKAAAVDLLGAAGSARAAGDLGVAWELGRQAAAKWPAYTEAQQFVKDVEAQKKAAEEAAAQAAVAAAHARAERDRASFEAQTDAWLANMRAGRSPIYRYLTKETFIPSVRLAPGDDDELILTVGVWFQQVDASVQPSNARWMWETWAKTHSPDDLERSRIRIVDLHDLPLGGSGPRSAGGGSNLKIDPSWPPILSSGPAAGKTYAVGNWKYTVLQTLRLPRIYARNTIDPTRYTYAQPKGEYVVVGLELENIGRENFGLNSWDFQLYDANGIKYTSTSVYLTGWPKQLGYDGTVGGGTAKMPPGVAGKYVIAFDVAPGAQGLQLRLVQTGTNIPLS
jgi:hypothetical protein